MGKWELSEPILYITYLVGQLAWSIDHDRWLEHG